MKKLSVLIPALIVSMLFIQSALAASFSFNPSSGTYDEGQIYNISIYVNPASDSVYTAKAEVKFPADLLEVRSFNFGSGWMALNQPGYDEINNSKGFLIKSGGYTGGLSDRVLFGTITFHAKNSGSASISIGSNSIILDYNSEDVLTSYSSASFTLSGRVEPIPTISVPNQAQEVSSPAVNTVEEDIVDSQVADVAKDDSVVFVEPPRANFTAMVLGLAWAGYLHSPLLILLTILAVLGLAAIAKKDKFFAVIEKLKKGK